ncbi:hypothetical protein B5C26_10155 [Photorhabdus luminescens]|uniref:hypothetical protein n=1 Tax=Photorhabdus luminescens TaxID=29488 RepID=UPI000B4CBE9D|nr:hypothetical protein [Photorhabdus luminescens]OWO82359.1 hypothetical protein B5C26_10155 [Photorhabdus luminescens]
MSENKKHVHAELMMQYAHDALKTDEPWLMWERFYIKAIGWEQCPYNPAWNPEFKYRRKQELITVGKVSFPKPVDYELKAGQEYWIAGQHISQEFWGGYNSEKEKLEYGIIHLTKEAAKQHAEALIKISRGEF